ncbi:MAG: response regulator [Candidatus Tectomicrobia bacterium]|uniref:histidine kinase n=1 Tax=Tectimicrobiota bacterium TaxID=2528274 RepID=A0A932FXL9_UNCTE|nr:response regulator [Candidatus Tectomicrobia bacterium]
MSDRSQATILNVDDDEADRYATSRILQQKGFRVIEAATGGEALLRVAEGPDLIVLDVHLPDIHGFEVCRQIKTDPATARIPILHLSATFLDSQSQVNGLDNGADAYLTQPVEPPVLIATVRALLRMRQAEAAAQAAARQWQTTFDVIQNGACLLDREGRIVRCNQAMAEILGRPSGEILGRAFCELLYRATGSLEACPLLYGGESGDDGSTDLTVGDRWYLVTVNPLLNEDGQLAGAIHIMTDITERKRAEEALKEADCRKDEFLAMLAHELRNPLAAIASAVQLLCRRKSDVPALDLAREVAERQVQHMTCLLDDLLDVSRITRGKIELRKQPVDLSTVVDHAIQTSSSLIHAQKHELSVSLPAEPLQLEADPDRLVQIFSNLLNNAAKYTPPGGCIWLTAGSEGGKAPGSGPGQAVVRVRDNGMGISPEVLSHVFDLFVQAHRSMDRSQGGLGIGLTLVKRLVELHGGSVEAHSTGPDQGSEFVVRLPLRPMPAPGPSPAAPSATAGVPARRRILLVDDNEDAARLMALILEMGGHEVRVVHDGPTAIAAAVEDRPDVVLLDIGLPRMDGYEVARRLRQHDSLARTILIAITGYGQEEDRQRSEEVGFAHHLVKPVASADLLRLLAEMFEAR